MSKGINNMISIDSVYVKLEKVKRWFLLLFTSDIVKNLSKKNVSYNEVMKSLEFTKDIYYYKSNSDIWLIINGANVPLTLFDKIYMNNMYNYYETEYMLDKEEYELCMIMDDLNKIQKL
jgi:hypothetical protein